MKIKGIINEDFINYKKPCMTIMMPYCDFKCGGQYCQNSALAEQETIEISDNYIISLYSSNDITKAICFQGLEPFDSWEELYNFIKTFRTHKYNKNKDDIVIYTGYTEEEIQDKIELLKEFSNIYIKFGRYVPNDVSHFDFVLGVNLISANQYGKKIS